MPITSKSLELKKQVSSFISQNSPIITSAGFKIDVTDVVFEEPDINDYESQISMKTLKEGSLDGSVKAKITVTNPEGKKVSSTRVIELFKLPYATERGTYIVNGNEKSVLSQMRLKPGVYISSGNLIKAEIMIDNRKSAGAYVPGITAEYNPANSVFSVHVIGNNRLNIGGMSFLTALGFTDAEIRNIIGNNAFGDEIKRVNQGKNIKTLQEIYRAIVGIPAVGSDVEVRAALFSHLAQNAKFGNGQMNIKSSLNSNEKALTKSLIRSILIKLFSVANSETTDDDKDDLRNKDIYDDNDFIIEKIEEGWKAFEKYCDQNYKSNKIDPVSISKGVKGISKPLDSFLRKDGEGVVQSPEETNPLFLESMNKKITQLGKGGMSTDSARNAFSSRSLAQGSMSRLDPVETPESSNIGFVEHLTQSAEIKNKTILVKLYKVKNSKAKADESNVAKLSPHDEFSRKVAFNDPRYIKYEKGEYIFTKSVAAGRFEGKIAEIPVSEIEFVDEKPQSVLGVATSMIPFVQHDDGNRALMGAAMQKQAILLKGREVPLVSSIADIKTGSTYEDIVGQEYGKPVYSKINGTVKKADKGVIILSDSKGEEHKYTYYEYYPLNQTYMHNELQIKVGDAVKVGDMLAEGWQTKGGTLALGINAKVGYIPFKGQNYEDGIVVSESFAKRMTTSEVDTYEVSIPAMSHGGKGSGIYDEVLAYTTNTKILSNLDNDGIIKVGSKISPGSVLAVCLKPQYEESADLEERIRSRGEKFRLDSLTIPPTSYVRGTVKRIESAPGVGNVKERLIFTIEDEKVLKRGDKIAGRHGNKGTISLVVPDDLMPVAEDGQALEVLFSPLAIPSRKNIGQVLEVGAGLIAEKTGTPYKVNNFDPGEEKRVLDGLKAIGYEDGKMMITLKELGDDGKIHSVNAENKSTVGNMYFMKLKHKVDEKIQSRSNIETAPSRKTNMPSKQVGSSAGEKYNPQSLGEMEMRALQGHGAAWTMLESTTLKADGGGDVQTRAAIFDAIATGKLDEVDVPSRPETLNVLSDTLKSLGLSVKPMYADKEVESFDDVFNSIAITPVKQSNFEKIFGKENEVYDPRMLKAKDLDIIQRNDKIKNNKFKQVFGLDRIVDNEDEAKFKGSLADPEIFGPLNPSMGDNEGRKKWGYVKLATPLANPILLKSSNGVNPYAALLGMKPNDIKAIADGRKILVIDPSEYEALDQFDESKPEEKELKEEFVKNIRNIMEEKGIKSGDYITPEEADHIAEETGQGLIWKVGGEALRYSLDKIKVKDELKLAQADLKNATGEEIDAQYKRVRTLKMLQNNKMQPSDLMMSYVPVAPLYLRPINKGRTEADVISSDLNTLYKNLIVANKPLKDLDADTQGMYFAKAGMAVSAARSTSSLSKRLEELYGVTERTERGNTLVSLTGGLGGKDALIRGSMMSKKQDFSGRSVIGVDPALTIDEVAIPMDMAKNIYKPFIIKELVDSGLAKDVKEAERKIKSSSDTDVKDAVRKIAKDRPVNLNRQPTLHKLGYLSFNPVIKDHTDNNEKITSIQLNPLIVEAFNADFDGDQMAVHVPVTENAKEESKNMLKPTSNLINPTSGKIMINIRQEMVLGIYHLTMKWDKPEGTSTKTYGTWKELNDAYLTGKINSRTRVSCPDGKFGGQGAMNVTCGQALFNLLIPTAYRNYKQVWGSTQLNGSGDKLGLFQQMYRDGEESGWKNISVFKLAAIMDSVKTLGFNASTRSGISLGLNDFKKMKGADKLFDGYLKESMKTHGDKEEALIDASRKFEAEAEKRIKAGDMMDEDNPLNIMMVSGARAKADQVRRMVVTVGVGKDVNNNLVTPIKSSLLDGLSPSEYWIHGLDSRKGMSDRSVATSKPGELTRQIWSAAQDLVISEADCNTKDGIFVKKNNATLYGRFVAEDIVSNGKIAVSRSQIINSKIIEVLYKDDKIQSVKVRSSMRCKAKDGVCQKCYGAMPGTLQLPKMGTAIGTLASQAMGEPATQMTMNTFHAGGTASNVSSGLPKVQRILNMSFDANNKGGIAEVSGIVTDIKDTGREAIITVGTKKHKIAKLPGETKNVIKVRVGDTVSAGDLLTYGSVEDFQDAKDGIILTEFDPKEMMARKTLSIGQEEASNYVKDYVSANLKNTLIQSGADSLDDRHIETIVTKLTSTAKVSDPGDSTFMKGQVVRKNEIDDWNKINTTLASARVTPVNDSLIGRKSGSDYFNSKREPIIKARQVFTPETIEALKKSKIVTVKVMLSPAVYESEVSGKNRVSTAGRDNWFSNLGYQDIKSQLATGASFGQIDKLNEPRAVQMAGKLMDFADIMKIPNTDAITSSIKNLLSQKKKRF